MVASGRNGCDWNRSSEALDFNGDGAFIKRSISKLAIEIIPPGPYGPIPLNGQGVILPGGDGYDLS